MSTSSGQSRENAWLLTCVLFVFVMRNGAVALLWPSLPPSVPLSPSLAWQLEALILISLSLSLSLSLLARCLRDTTVLISQHAEPSRHSTAAAAASVQQHQAVCVLAAAAARARPPVRVPAAGTAAD